MCEDSLVVWGPGEDGIKGSVDGWLDCCVDDEVAAGSTGVKVKKASVSEGGGFRFFRINSSYFCRSGSFAASGGGATGVDLFMLCR